ncbi:NAD/NADP-dependent betaine aldehyde dehydrogenase [Nymphon striatum]|nr:NAD/NADP-dependent betaine aldehyde dehydrogenase [Nymphon striatum]
MIFDNCLVASCNKNEGFNTSCNCFIDCILNSLSTIVSISFGTALVAGKKRVPRPATGKTALRIGLGTIMLHFQKDDPTTKVNAFDWWYHNMGSVTGAGIAEITNQMEYDDEVSHHACAKLYDLSRGKDKRPWCLTKGKAWYHLAKVKYVKVPWQWNMPQKGSYAPLISLRSGKWKFNRCSIDPDQLFDMETDPHELNNLASNPAYSQVAAEFRAQATKRWNLEQFDSDVRHSQASRWIVYEALRNGKYFPWDYQPLQKASERYMRNHMDLNVLEENQRFPRATGEVIAKVHSATPAIIEQAINSAQSAQKKWAATSNADRGRILRKAAAIIRERNRDLSILESYDTGKPLQETLVADATSGADSLEYFGGLAATLTGEHIPLGESWAYTKFISRQVYQLVYLTSFKASANVGAELVNDRRIDKVSLTGSVPTGKKVYANAASQIKHVTMEVGKPSEDCTKLCCKRHQRRSNTFYGGNRIERDGFFLEPTIFCDVKDDMVIAREEIFGPVMCVLDFDDEVNVIARANDTEFGLAAGIFTNDLTRAHRVISKLEAGTWCALAYRLSESGASVLVIEHGGTDIGPFIQMPAALSYPMNMSRYDWGFQSEPEPHLGGRCLATPRGKVIGGSSSINGMVYVRGHAEDYNTWAQMGADDMVICKCTTLF